MSCVRVRNRDATTRESTTHTQQHATREQRELLVTKMYFIHSFMPTMRVDGFSRFAVRNRTMRL